MRGRDWRCGTVIFCESLRESPVHACLVRSYLLKHRSSTRTTMGYYKWISHIEATFQYTALP